MCLFIIYISIFLVSNNFLLNAVKCANILGVFPSAGYSQFILSEKLMTTLAKRGHNVTVISAYKPKENVTNYTTILMDSLIEETAGDLFYLENSGVAENIISTHKLGAFLTQHILSHESVQNLLKSNSSFDLVIIEQFFNEATMGFARHFSAPLVLFSSIGLAEWNAHLIGNPNLPSVLPISFTDHTSKMSFAKRFLNSYFYMFNMMYKQFVAYPQHQVFLDKYFPKKMKLTDIMYNASLLLLNSHPSVNEPSTLNSAVVEIGGFHVTTKPLPIQLQDFLSSSKHGAILFSLGTNLNSSNLPTATLNNILSDLGKLKQNVLWKFESEDIVQKPANLLISKWLPQSDILAHPNTIAFITHGGLLSVTEATMHGVPMIGIPVFGDQQMNIARVVETKLGVRVPLQNLAIEGELYSAISEVITNTKYSINSRRVAKIFNDRPVHPLDLAMYYIEYVLRHKGASHLRHRSLDLQWYQVYLLDVIVFVILLFVTISFLLSYILRLIFNKIIKNKVKAGSKYKFKSQ